MKSRYIARLYAGTDTKFAVYFLAAALAQGRSRNWIYIVSKFQEPTKYATALDDFTTFPVAPPLSWTLPQALNPAVDEILSDFCDTIWSSLNAYEDAQATWDRLVKFTDEHDRLFNNETDRHHACGWVVGESAKDVDEKDALLKNEITSRVTGLASRFNGASKEADLEIAVQVLKGIYKDKFSLALPLIELVLGIDAYSTSDAYQFKPDYLTDRMLQCRRYPCLKCNGVSPGRVLLALRTLQTHIGGDGEPMSVSITISGTSPNEPVSIKFEALFKTDVFATDAAKGLNKDSDLKKPNGKAFKACQVLREATSGAWLVQTSKSNPSILILEGKFGVKAKQ